jgi:hypothetical protein
MISNEANKSYAYIILPYITKQQINFTIEYIQHISSSDSVSELQDNSSSWEEFVSLLLIRNQKAKFWNSQTILKKQFKQDHIRIRIMDRQQATNKSVSRDNQDILKKNLIFKQHDIGCKILRKNPRIA